MPVPVLYFFCSSFSTGNAGSTSHWPDTTRWYVEPGAVDRGDMGRGRLAADQLAPRTRQAGQIHPFWLGLSSGCMRVCMCVCVRPPLQHVTWQAGWQASFSFKPPDIMYFPLRRACQPRGSEDA